jgi:hypothetical protein
MKDKVNYLQPSQYDESAKQWNKMAPEPPLFDDIQYLKLLTYNVLFEGESVGLTSYPLKEKIYTSQRRPKMFELLGSYNCRNGN